LSIWRVELETPLPDASVAYGDAALGKDIFEISDVETEEMSKPNNLWRLSTRQHRLTRLTQVGIGESH
jgi:hypothetical protein